MIKQDKGNVQIEGTTNELVSEVGLLVHSIASEVEKRTGTSYSEVIDHISTVTELYKLVASGMGTDEAIEVLGLTDTVIKMPYDT